MCLVPLLSGQVSLGMDPLALCQPPPRPSQDSAGLGAWRIEPPTHPHVHDWGSGHPCTATTRGSSDLLLWEGNCIEICAGGLSIH